MPGRPALATRMSTSPRARQIERSARRLGEIGDRSRWPSPGSPAASASSSSGLRELSTTLAPRLGERRRDRAPEAAGRAGQQDASCRQISMAGTYQRARGWRAACARAARLPRRESRTAPLSPPRPCWRCAAILAPGRSVGAAVLDARSVLPPGQSGYVSIPGSPSGTGSPHLTDQIEPLHRLRATDAGFDQPGRHRAAPRPGVEIVRDAYGVPAVTGATDYDAWWGVGYAVAAGPPLPARAVPPGGLGAPRRDPRLDLPRRRPDRPSRLLHRRRDRPDGRAASRADLLSRAEAYRDGINAYIDIPRGPTRARCRASSPRCRSCRSTMDAARLGPHRRAARPHGALGRRQRARERAGARRDRPQGLRSPAPGPHQGPDHAPCRAREGSFPAQPGRTRKDERRAYRRTRRYLRGHRPRPSARRHRRRADRRRGPRARAPTCAGSCPHGGSFMWAIRDEQRKRGYLFNGPQLGFSIPELFVEFEIHSPGQRTSAGVSAAGIPLVGDRPQRARRLGLHLRALRRGRPLRREAGRRRDLPLQGRGAADGVPRRDLRLPHPRRPTCPT